MYHAAGCVLVTVVGSAYGSYAHTFCGYGSLRSSPHTHYRLRLPVLPFVGYSGYRWCITVLHYAVLHTVRWLVGFGYVYTFGCVCVWLLRFAHVGYAVGLHTVAFGYTLPRCGYRMPLPATVTHYVTAVITPPATRYLVGCTRGCTHFARFTISYNLPFAGSGLPLPLHLPLPHTTARFPHLHTHCLPVYSSADCGYVLRFTATCGSHVRDTAHAAVHTAYARVWFPFYVLPHTLRCIPVPVLVAVVFY